MADEVAGRRTPAPVVGGLLVGPGALFDGLHRAVGAGRAPPIWTSGSWRTDIDTERAGRPAGPAVYEEQLLEGIPANMRSQYFERGASDRRGFGVREAARQMVAFRELNLNGPSWPMKGPFDAIFCRNVVIYFDEPTQERVWQRFAPLVAPGGTLYIGHSERVGRVGHGL